MSKYTFDDIWNAKEPLKPDGFIYGVSVSRHKWKDKVCVMCGCEKMNFGYSRNGHVFVVTEALNVLRQRAVHRSQQLIGSDVRAGCKHGVDSRLTHHHDQASRHSVS